MRQILYLNNTLAGSTEHSNGVNTVSWVEETGVIIAKLNPGPRGVSKWPPHPGLSQHPTNSAEIKDLNYVEDTWYMPEDWRP